MAFDPISIRRQFPFFGQEKPPIYLDNAATTQKPASVLEAMDRFYRLENGSALRGFHPLAEGAMQHWNDARRSVATFLGAASPESIVFTSGATGSLNILARSLGETWNKGDAVAISLLEHHSNIVPWQQLHARGIDVRWIDCDERGCLNLNDLDAALGDGRVRLVSITAQSNVLGVRPDLPEIIRRAHAAKALVSIDAAQAVAHGPINVQSLDCDALVFSAHKLCGPTGLGVLYAKPSLLASMPPFFGGGGMVHDVTTEGFIALDPPQKFEAGTLPVASAVGLAAAIQWWQSMPHADVANHERALLQRAMAIAGIPGVRILGPENPADRYGCLSFVVDDLHAHDLTDQLVERDIYLRGGHHCAKPLHQRLNVTASTRLSVAPYTTIEDIDHCVQAVGDIVADWRRRRS